MSCNHCWHETGIALTTNPPQYPEVCCHCGEQRVVYGYAPMNQEGHGKYLPKPTVVHLPVYDFDTLPRSANAHRTEAD